eukprot:g3990.t1
MDLPPLPFFGEDGGDESVFAHAAMPQRSAGRKMLFTGLASTGWNRNVLDTKRKSQIEVWPKASQSRPPLLSQLEDFISAELALQNNVSEERHHTASAARLQVYREAFQRFMEEFRTYKPLLSQIKSEYESLLDAYARQLHLIPPLRARLSTLQAEATQKMRRLKESHKAEMARFTAKHRATEEKNKELEKLNSQLGEDNIKLTKEFDVQRTRYLDMKTANVNLVKALQTRDRSADEGADAFQRQKDRATKLAAQLEQLQIKYDEACRTISEIQKRERDDVPKVLPSKSEVGEEEEEEEAKDKGDKGDDEVKNESKIVELQKELAHAKRELTATLSAHEQLSAEHSRLIKIVEMTTGARARDNLKKPTKPSKPSESADKGGTGRNREKHRKGEEEEMQALRKAAEACGVQSKVDTLQGLLKASLDLISKQRIDLQQQKSSRKTSSSSRVMPFKPILGGTARAVAKEALEALPLTRNEDDFFVGYGIGENVPPYLRITGRVRKRHLDKRAVEQMVKACWAMKERERNKDPLSSYLAHFLAKRYEGDHALIAEWGYNLVSGLERYSYDADCDLFRKVLAGELPEQVFRDQGLALRKLQEDIVKTDRDEHTGTQKGLISKQGLMSVIAAIAPLKSKESTRELEEALFAEVGSSTVIDYIKLFKDDANGNQGRFAECFRDQHLEETIAYIEELENAILAKGLECGDLHVSDLREVILAVDPGKPEDELDEYVARGCNVPADQLHRLADAFTIDAKLFSSRLRNGHLHRSSLRK